MITIITSSIDEEFTTLLRNYLIKNGEYVNFIHRGHLPGLRLLDRIRDKFNDISVSDLLILIQVPGYPGRDSYETREAHEKIFAEFCRVPVMTIIPFCRPGEKMDFSYAIAQRVDFWRKGIISTEQLTKYKTTYSGTL